MLGMKHLTAPLGPLPGAPKWPEMVHSPPCGPVGTQLQGAIPRTPQDKTSGSLSRVGQHQHFWASKAGRICVLFQIPHTFSGPGTRKQSQRHARASSLPVTGRRLPSPGTCTRLLTPPLSTVPLSTCHTQKEKKVLR